MSNYLVYVGTYTGPVSQGIYVYKLDMATKKLAPLGLAVESTNPSFLAIHPNRRFLYAVNETSTYNGQNSGSVAAFTIDRKTGKLALLNVVSSENPLPCHLVVDNTGTNVLAANYAVGSVVVLPILANGLLGKATACILHTGHSVNPVRQERPHAHSIYVSPDNRFVVAADLGTDQVYVYKFDATEGMLKPNNPASVFVPEGSGPRHFAFHPSGKLAYVIEEIGSSITAFSYDAEGGVLHSLETVSTLPNNFKGESTTAEIEIHPSGKFLYGSNRGDDSIAVFAIDQALGTLSPVEYVSTQGKTPRGFAIDPTGTYLIAGNQDTNTLVVFHIDQESGRLKPTGQVLEIQAPACVVFVPAD